MLLNVHYSSSVRALSLGCSSCVGCVPSVYFYGLGRIDNGVIFGFIVSYQFTLLSHHALHQSVK